MADVPQDCGRCGAPAPPMQDQDSVRCEFCGAIISRPAPEPTPPPEPEPEIIVVEALPRKRRRRPRKRWQDRIPRRRRPRREPDYYDDLEYDLPEPRRQRGTLMWPILIPIIVLLFFFFAPCLMCGGIFSLPIFGAVDQEEADLRDG